MVCLVSLDAVLLGYVSSMFERYGMRDEKSDGETVSGKYGGSNTGWLVGGTIGVMVGW
jgi:hypothetical protein